MTRKKHKQKQISLVANGVSFKVHYVDYYHQTLEDDDLQKAGEYIEKLRLPPDIKKVGFIILSRMENGSLLTIGMWANNGILEPQQAIRTPRTRSFGEFTECEKIRIPAWDLPICNWEGARFRATMLNGQCAKPEKYLALVMKKTEV